MIDIFIITNISRQLVPILVESITPETAAARSTIPPEANDPLMIPAKTVIIVEASRIDLGQIYNLAKRLILRYTSGTSEPLIPDITNPPDDTEGIYALTLGDGPDPTSGLFLTNFTGSDTLVKVFAPELPALDIFNAIGRSADDNLFYYLAERQDDEIVLTFMSYDRETDILTPISLSGNGVTADPGVSATVQNDEHISDGGDMFDEGNAMFTNLSLTAIPYTHTQQTVSEVDEIIINPNGTVDPGDTWFGAGSSYFTNLYHGFFVCCATGVTGVTKFDIGGGLEADGNGDLVIAQFQVTVASQLYTVFFKKVYNSDKSSIGHLIIVQGNGSGLTHTASISTDDDTDIVSGGSLGSTVYYMLFSNEASAVGGTKAEELVTAQAIATAFLTAVGPGSIATKLTALNAAAATITAAIPDATLFSDQGNEPPDIFRGKLAKLDNLAAMTYLGDDTFMVAAGNQLFTLTTTGILTFLKNTDFNLTGLALFTDTLYAVSNSVLFLIITDLEGNFLNEVSDNVFNMSFSFDDSALFGLTSFNDQLYTVRQDIGDATTYTLCVIDGVVAANASPIILDTTDIKVYDFIIQDIV